MTPIEQIIKLEKALIQAMLTSDVKQLDLLISNDLVFTAHTGEMFSKTDDLEAHHSGNIRIETIEPSEQIIKVYNTTAIVSVLLKIKGDFFGHVSEGQYRFTRIWIKDTISWKIVAAHSTTANS